MTTRSIDREDWSGCNQDDQRTWRCVPTGWSVLWGMTECRAGWVAPTWVGSESWPFLYSVLQCPRWGNQQNRRMEGWIGFRHDRCRLGVGFWIVRQVSDFWNQDARRLWDWRWRRRLTMWLFAVMKDSCGQCRRVPGASYPWVPLLLQSEFL